MNDNLKNEILFSIFERTIRRLWILCIVLIIMLVATNAGWLYYARQFEMVVTTQTIDSQTDGTGDVTCIIGERNEVTEDGESESNKDN
jgi:hypothetical protein